MVKTLQPGIAQALREAADSPMTAPLISGRPWLKLACFLGLTVLMMLASSIALALVLLAVPQLGELVDVMAVLPEGPNRLLGESHLGLVLALSIGLIGFSTLAAAALTWRRPLRDFLSPGRQFDLRLIVIGFGFMTAVAALFVPVSLLWGSDWSPPVLDPGYRWETRVIYAFAMAGSLLVAAAAEEIIFRAVLLRLTGLVIRQPVVICLLNGLLFSAIHLDPDPVAFIARAFSGTIWTWAALRLGGIEFAIGAHFANNLFITLVWSPLSDDFQPIRSEWIELAPEGVVLLVTLAAIEWLVKKRTHPVAPPHNIDSTSTPAGKAIV